jgi:PASTA domain
MDPDSMQGGGGLMGSRILGIPVLVWVAGAALIAYFIFSRSSSGSSGGGTSTAGGSDTLTTGNTTVESGAVRVVVNAGNDTDNPQPKPPVKGKTRTVTVPEVVGDRGEAARDKITKAGFRFRQIPPRTPRGKTTTVTSETPRGGSKAKKGATVTTHVKVNR